MVGEYCNESPIFKFDGRKNVTLIFSMICMVFRSIAGN